MNDNELDKLLASRLKNEGYRAGENEWFTRRLLNKLPPRTSNTPLRVGKAFFALAALMVLAFWIWTFADMRIVTVRDLLSLITAGMVSLAIISAPIISIFRRQ